MIGIGVALGLMSHGHSASAAGRLLTHQATLAKCGCHGGATITASPGQTVGNFTVPYGASPG